MSNGIHENAANLTVFVVAGWTRFKSEYSILSFTR